MAILAGNLASRISFRLQFRVLSILWVEKNPTILCLKGRDHSSSAGPVRYVPKRPSKRDKAENSLPNMGFEKKLFDRRLDDAERDCVLEKRNQSKMRSCNGSVLSDDAKQDFSEMENESNQNLGVKDHAVKKGYRAVFEEIQIQLQHDSVTPNMQVHDSIQDAEKFAIKLLATRAYTAVELRKKLLGKKFAPDILDAVINDFQKRGLINDGLYAETFSRSRWSASSWGPRRIKQALLKKGVDEADTDKALDLVFQDGKSEEEESKLGLSKLSLDHLLTQASKQWLRGQDVPKETRKSRIIRWLQYRGFNWDIISFVLKKLESQYSTRAH